MNIDRPLDEIIQESRNARRAQRAAKRKVVKQVRKKANPISNNPPPLRSVSAPLEARPVASDNKLGALKKRSAIGKPQRRRIRTKNRAIIASDVEQDVDGLGHIEHENGVENPRRSGGVTDRLATRNVRTTRGVKVAVSNLHPGVTQTDIKELFETVGPLKTATLKTYASGESACAAEVVFEAMGDALEAIKRYNLVPLDNQPLHITLATDSVTGGAEPVQNRIGKMRGRPATNGRKKLSPEPDYDHGDDSPRADGYGPSGDSPIDERPAGNNVHGRRGNRKRYRRFPNNKSANGNGVSGAGDREMYVD